MDHIAVIEQLKALKSLNAETQRLNLQLKYIKSQSTIFKNNIEQYLIETQQQAIQHEGIQVYLKSGKSQQRLKKPEKETKTTQALISLGLRKSINVNSFLESIRGDKIPCQKLRIVIKSDNNTKK